MGGNWELQVQWFLIGWVVRCLIGWASVLLSYCFSLAELWGVLLAELLPGEGRSFFPLLVVLKWCPLLLGLQGASLSGGSVMMFSVWEFLFYPPSSIFVRFSFISFGVFFCIFNLILCFLYFYIILGCYWTIIKLLGLESTKITNIKANCSDAFLFDSQRRKSYHL